MIIVSIYALQQDFAKVFLYNLYVTKHCFIRSGMIFFQLL